MKSKSYILLGIVIIFFPILIIAFTVSDMSSKPSIEMAEENIALKAPLCAGVTIEYHQISSIEYIDKFDFGEKKKGKVDEKFIAGLYKNEEFGNYYIVANNTCDRYIKIEYKNEYYIFNSETLEQTKSDYKYICEKIDSIPEDK